MANISQGELFSWVLFAYVQNFLGNKKKYCAKSEFCGKKKLKIKQVGRKV